MANSHSQLRTLRDDLGHLANLPLVVGQTDGKDEILYLQQLEHRQHVQQRLFQKPVRRKRQAAQSHADGLPRRLHVSGHTQTTEAVGIGVLHLGKIGVLVAVNDFLYHDRSPHLRIVHVGEEHLGGVPAVGHEWWQHLHLLTEEQRARSVGRQRADGLSVHHGVLFQPKVAVCIDNHTLCRV